MKKTSSKKMGVGVYVAFALVWFAARIIILFSIVYEEKELRYLLSCDDAPDRDHQLAKNAPCHVA